MTTNKLNKARVADLHMTMTDHVERGDIPGMVTLIGRGDEVYVDAIGMKNVGGKEPMRRETIFRVASITKPITAAATMILVDDDKLELDDSVERWLPELANRNVLRRIDSPLDDTVPAKRSITVRDLVGSTRIPCVGGKNLGTRDCCRCSYHHGHVFDFCKSANALDQFRRLLFRDNASRPLAEFGDPIVECKRVFW